eukprot:Pgem_evm1s8826
MKFGFEKHFLGLKECEKQNLLLSLLEHCSLSTLKAVNEKACELNRSKGNSSCTYFKEIPTEIILK